MVTNAILMAIFHVNHGCTAVPKTNSNANCNSYFTSFSSSVSPVKQICANYSIFKQMCLKDICEVQFSGACEKHRPSGIFYTKYNDFYRCHSIL